ncbi:MAG: hypothetical protein EOP81_14920 [Variovorax sp.]|nr:MAG: hypothetical protein EOP81_14920 [Variovorax sp.]
MPWLKLLHISAVIVWCGALLYLPAAVVAAGVPVNGAASSGSPPLRRIFTGVATPAALIAIASGSAIFLLQGPLVPWLIAKLALVALLVLGHGACGMLILRVERNERRGLHGLGVAVSVTTVAWLLGIAWLVLAKPF